MKRIIEPAISKNSHWRTVCEHCDSVIEVLESDFDETVTYINPQTNEVEVVTTTTCPRCGERPLHWFFTDGDQIIYKPRSDLWGGYDLASLRPTWERAFKAGGNTSVQPDTNNTTMDKTRTETKPKPKKKVKCKIIEVSTYWDKGKGDKGNVSVLLIEGHYVCSGNQYNHIGTIINTTLIVLEELFNLEFEREYEREERGMGIHDYYSRLSLEEIAAKYFV